MEDMRRMTVDSCEHEKERLSLLLKVVVPFLILTGVLLFLTLIIGKIVMVLLSLTVFSLAWLLTLDICSCMLKLTYKINEIKDETSKNNHF